MTDTKRGPLVVVGTSGSTDYLSGATGGRRFWPVTSPDEGEGCDGLHDEGAPVNFLCTRCFSDPGRGDLALGSDDEEDAYRDEPHETE